MALFTANEKKDFTPIPTADGKARKRFSEKVKDKARKLVLEEKNTRKAVAEELDISTGTLGTWFKAKGESAEDLLQATQQTISDLKDQVEKLEDEIAKKDRLLVEAEAKYAVMKDLYREREGI